MSDDKKITTLVKIPKLPKDATSIEWGLTKLKLQTACARRGCLPAFSLTASTHLSASEGAVGNDTNK